MLHRFTGTIVHIDFGDCFEVAMDREKYPEKIPFRLTRMLTNAMEVSGIEGNFRFSCESVMAVLRENRHSLMAMLEAFVHDPLINWPANRVREDTIDENEESDVVEKIDYTTTNLHAEISSLAASVSSVGHSSLSRSFSVTQAQIQVQSRAAEQQKQQADDGQTVQVERQPVAPSTPLGPPPRMAPAASTSFVSVTAAAQIPPSSDAVPPSVSNDLHANRSVRERELLSALGPEGIAAPRIALNEKAVAVIRRVQAKLSGRDFEGDGGEPLDVSAQVQRLISQATSHENLCQCYIGWCPFW
ncbi:Phosphatidylinositol 3-Kinase tor2-like protein [Phytophthora palmivora]|uniref:Phosphatidylinositol 3-Kinase tor2-like protein n=1 Tax=Phytophthora palmivora TaxID=4796 RepID=A0A2P4Y5B1_9STRA|nr:Phosphatidylinositol 3-Kinase tor2-like protein [Phytophthora palmivora]